jgi:aspartate racemase
MEIMQIGLIGGIGPAATDFYYRRLIARFRARLAPLALTISHADTWTLLDNLGRNDKARKAKYLSDWRDGWLQPVQTVLR